MHSISRRFVRVANTPIDVFIRAANISASFEVFQADGTQHLSSFPVCWARAWVFLVWCFSPGWQPNAHPATASLPSSEESVQETGWTQEDHLAIVMGKIGSTWEKLIYLNKIDMIYWQLK